MYQQGEQQEEKIAALLFLKKAAELDNKSLADKAVFRARRLAFISLFSLLVLQIYWLIGVSSNSKLIDITEKIENEEAALNSINETNANFKLQQDKIVSLKQQQNANYELLLSWNKIWLTAIFKEEFTGDINSYRQFKYDNERADTQQMEGDIEKEIRKEKLYNQLWLNLLSAEYVLKALSAYFLPLLYGLLGATMFIMRSLSKDIKNMGYAADKEINYRLRTTMGALGGLTIGWFIAPEDGLNVNIVSTSTMAFLTGYNVELLFSTMDRVIEMVNKQIEGVKKTV